MVWARGELVLVKLGGSLITDKRGEAKLRPGRLRRIAAELAAALEQGGPPVLLGHGSGSFGHVAAQRHGFADQMGPPTAADIAAVQAAAARLHAEVLDALRRAGIPAFSQAPSSFLVANGGRPTSVATAPLRQALAAGLVPVTYGDVVTDRERGASICSTETVLLALARRLARTPHAARRAYWFGDTDGLFDERGATVACVEPGDLRRRLRATGGSGATDVTGGMHHRLATAGKLARLGVESWILDGTPPGAVAEALGGDPRGGTRVATGRRA